jgi:hypothetical protein
MKQGQRLWTRDELILAINLYCKLPFGRVYFSNPEVITAIKMKISFDLDDTIIPGLKTFETEQQTFLQKLCGIEKLRKGTIQLFRELKANKHQVGIYTSCKLYQGLEHQTALIPS